MATDPESECFAFPLVIPAGSVGWPSTSLKPGWTRHDTRRVLACTGVSFVISYIAHIFWDPPLLLLVCLGFLVGSGVTWLDLTWNMPPKLNAVAVYVASCTCREIEWVAPRRRRGDRLVEVTMRRDGRPEERVIALWQARSGTVFGYDGPIVMTPGTELSMTPFGHDLDMPRLVTTDGVGDWRRRFRRR